MCLVLWDWITNVPSSMWSIEEEETLSLSTSDKAFSSYRLLNQHCPTKCTHNPIIDDIMLNELKSCEASNSIVLIKELINDSSPVRNHELLQCWGPIHIMVTGSADHPLDINNRKNPRVKIIALLPCISIHHCIF